MKESKTSIYRKKKQSNRKSNQVSKHNKTKKKPLGVEKEEQKKLCGSKRETGIIVQEFQYLNTNLRGKKKVRMDAFHLVLSITRGR